MANQNELEVILKMQGTRQFMADAGSAKGAVQKIGAETDKAAKKTDRMAKAQTRSAKATDRAAGSAKNLIGGYIAFQTVTSGFGFVRDATTEARDAMRQTEAVIKSTGGVANVTADQVGDLAGSIADVAGIDDELIQQGSNLLLTFKGIRNETGKGNDIFDQANQVMVDMSVAMGQDMKSSAMQLGKALNDPTRGLNMLRRVGISFTKQQENQIKKMQKSGNVIGAQKIMIKELESQFGGSAKAQATSSRRLGVAFENMAEIVGLKLEPYFQKLADAGIKTISWLTSGSTSAKAFLGILATGGAMLATYYTGLVLVGGATKAWAYAQSLLNKFQQASPMWRVITVIGLLSAALVVAYQRSETFRTFVHRAGQVGAAAFRAVRGAINWVIEKVQALIDKVQGAIDKMKSMSKTVKGWLPDAFGGGDPDRMSMQEWQQSINPTNKNLFLEQVGGRALGGSVYDPGVYMVGERGPEQVYLPRGAYVDATSSAGGGDVSVTVNPTLRIGNRTVADIVAEEVETKVARR